MLVPAAEAVTLGDVGGLAGVEAGPLDEAAPADEGELAGALAGLEAAAAAELLDELEAAAAAELLDELQAVTSKAAQANTAQTPACRVLRAFVVNLVSIPHTPQFSLAAR